MTQPKADEVLGADVHRVGNLTGDPTLHRGAERGTPYATFGVAVDEPTVPGDWSSGRETRFYDCVCFGTLARNVAVSVRKGDRVVLVGHVELSAPGTDTEAGVRERLVVEAAGPELRWATVNVKRRRDRRDT